MRALFLLAALATVASAQTVETGSGPVTLLPEGARTGVFVLDAEDGVLRAGPRLVEIAPNGVVTVPGRDPAFDPQTALDARAFTIEARADRVAVGLGFNDTTADADQPPATAAGYAVSTNGGQSYTYRFPALDQSRDSTVRYGISTLPAIPVTIAQGTAPLDLAWSPGADTLYSASLLAGLRRSTDDGATWQRVVLPPDTLQVLDPREPYDFVYSPDLRQPLGFVDGDPDQPVLSDFSTNFVAYSVVVHESGTVWVGTLGGLNRSVRLPGSDDPAWVRYTDAPIGGALPANWVFALETRPIAGAPDEVWAACVNSGNRFTSAEEEPGIAVWRGDDADGRPIFETVLLGVDVIDLAFDEVRAYAATSEGLYVSDDDGATWRVVRTFRRPDGTPLPLANARTSAVATTPGAVWVGTASGLLKSTDGARTWELFRADVRPGASADGDRTVDVYAYPNPFNPRNGDLRVRLDLASGSDVTIRVFDQAMNLVRTLDAPGRPSGPNEVFWDGQTDDGLRVANGVYIYTVEAAGERFSGRILVIQ
ncbi:FlgD immunoglobulin-like domain containing protein [Rubrivirga sp. IMCC45206]|uniref:FlgD immunoglobulin-like domain containing protein n=1 Tax=Rubrivirga sp. IMCC45206 TaxID=3391614 RepID=UPI00398FBF02